MPDPELVDQVAQILSSNVTGSDARTLLDGLLMDHGPAAVAAAAEHVQSTIREH